ncbi:MAG TPA: response regulator [Ktedonobacteraceae bacterium]|nr:response regulator [Ktedonobacteraceae bacterium]
MNHLTHSLTFNTYPYKKKQARVTSLRGILRRDVGSEESDYETKDHFHTSFAWIKGGSSNGAFEKRGGAMASRLLIIEDNLALLSLYQLILEPEVLVVIVTSAPLLDITEVERIHPDLILLDYHLGASGQKESLLHQLKTIPATAAIPLLIVTADAQVLYEQADYLSKHHVQVILKPFEIDELLRAVRQALLGAPLVLFSLLMFFS